ncbi:MAG TPA: hypothetical protein VF765_14785, partial [Polyangiaceae bacterium]
MRAAGGLLVAGLALQATVVACSSSPASSSAEKPRSDAGVAADASPDSGIVENQDSGPAPASDAGAG